MSKIAPSKMNVRIIKAKNDYRRDSTNSDVEEYFKDKYESYKILEPPYNLDVLTTMRENCSELGPAIDAMVINIEKIGFTIKSKENSNDNKDREVSPAVKREISEATTFFNNAVLDQEIGTFTEFKGRLREDLELTGNAYIEVIPNLFDKMKPEGMNHLQSWTMRISKVDSEYTDYEVPRAIRKDDGTYEIKTYYTRKKFRRYIQMDESVTDCVYFKEWGDPRNISSVTGEVLPDGETENLAHEVIHIKHYSARSPYGLPRWIGHLFAIYGTRAAEEINFVTLDNNQIPAMALLATNVNVTDGSIARMSEFIEERVQGNKNYATILMIEAEPQGEGLKDPASMKLELKPLTEFQHSDGMFKDYIASNNDMIRRSFRLPPIYVGRCVPIETEFLTENGWKKFDEITKTERIATINPKNGELVFQIPSNRYVYDYDDELIRFTNNRAIDALVTPNHRMLNRGVGEWVFTEARDMKKYHREFMLSSLKWNGEKEKYFEIPYTPRKNKCDIGSTKNWCRDFERRLRDDVNYKKIKKQKMNNFLAFLGYFVSEGSTSNRNRGAITLSQRSDNYDFQGRNISRCMINVMKRMGLKVGENSSDDRPNEMNIVANNIHLYEWLRENCGVGSHNKKFPRWILNLPRPQLKIFYKALMDGDGSWCSKGKGISGSYSTTSEELKDLFQELCFRLGYRSTARFIPAENDNWSDKWVITVSYKAVNHTCNVHELMSREWYKGQVCCFTTPNSTIVTRYNGKILVSGNSQDYNRAVAEASKKLAEEQIFMPERNAMDKLLTDTFLNRLKLPNVAFVSNKPNITDNYELTQLLATAERSGGLTPRIARRITADVVNHELPEVDDSINPDIPLSYTMNERNNATKLEIAKLKANTESFTDEDNEEPKETDPRLQDVMKSVYLRYLKTGKDVVELNQDEIKIIQEAMINNV